MWVSYNCFLLLCFRCHVSGLLLPSFYICVILRFSSEKKEEKNRHLHNLKLDCFKFGQTNQFLVALETSIHKFGKDKGEFLHCKNQVCPQKTDNSETGGHTAALCSLLHAKEGNINIKEISLSQVNLIIKKVLVFRL